MTNPQYDAIKQRLDRLKVTESSGEPFGTPWASNGQPISYNRRPPQTTVQNPSQRQAFEALKQRNAPGVGHYAPSPTVASVADAQYAPSQQSTSMHSHHPSAVDDMIAAEIQRLEMMAESVNMRSQQQAAEIEAMQQTAQQATLVLSRQGINAHPKLEILAGFLAHNPSAAVPHFDRDSIGRFQLTHNVVNLKHAEQQPTDGASSASMDYPPHQPKQTAKLTRQPSARTRTSEAPGEEPTASNRFSLVDASICFCVAVLVRILLDLLVLSFPALRTTVVLILFCLISFSIYRVVVSKSTSFTAAMRLGVVLVGLFVGGLF